MNEKIYELKEYLYSKKYYLIGGFILLLVVIIFLLIYFKKSSMTDSVVIEEKVNNTKLDKEVVYDKCLANVDIKGYIINPGMYTLECDKRIIDVINMAGGLKENADTSVINLSKKVFDEMVIIIYSNDEVNNFLKTQDSLTIIEDKCINEKNIKNDGCVTTKNRVETTFSITTSNNSNNDILDSNSPKLLSINLASLEELMTLSGIGESKAKAIINYRIENNGFKKLEELMNISGIGEKMFEKIKDSITL